MGKCSAPDCVAGVSACERGDAGGSLPSGGPVGRWGGGGGASGPDPCGWGNALSQSFDRRRGGAHGSKAADVLRARGPCGAAVRNGDPKGAADWARYWAADSAAWRRLRWEDSWDQPAHLDRHTWPFPGPFLGRICVKPSCGDAAGVGGWVGWWWRPASCGGTSDVSTGTPRPRRVTTRRVHARPAASRPAGGATRRRVPDTVWYGGEPAMALAEGVAGQ